MSHAVSPFSLAPSLNVSALSDARGVSICDPAGGGAGELNPGP